MENKKTNKYGDKLTISGEIITKPIKKENFDNTLVALFKIPPPQKNNK